MMLPSLRGGSQSFQGVDDSNLSRRLQTDSESESSAWFIAAIVALIVLFYIICMFQCVKLYILKCCRQDSAVANSGATGTVLVHEGRVFNLSEDQRRAVLEAIYADNSKPATDQDVGQKHKKRKRKVFGRESAYDNEDNEEFPMCNVEIPSLEVNASLETHYAREDDELGIISLGDPLFVGDSGYCASLSSEFQSGDDVDQEVHRWKKPTASVDCSSSSKPNSLTNLSVHPQLTIDASSTPRTKNCKSIRQLQELTNEASDKIDGDARIVVEPQNGVEGGLPDRCESMDSWDDHESNTPLPSLPLPELSSRFHPEKPNRLSGEAKERKSTNVFSMMQDDDGGDEDRIRQSSDCLSLFPSVPLARHESFTTQASEYTYDDDSCTTGDNVCPICLCGYVMGDILISSKHCSHGFHKECILEWLQKHDDCPVCRTSMVTESEMNRAATFLVGKTRMYRAVASMHPPNRHRSSSTSPSSQFANNRTSSTTVRPGTVRQSASPFF